MSAIDVVIVIVVGVVAVVVVDVGVLLQGEDSNVHDTKYIRRFILVLWNFKQVKYFISFM